MTCDGVVNAMTVDVEDYFHVSAFDGVVCRSTWDRFDSRVSRNTEALLDLFASTNVKATFFVLGWVAERFPALVRRISSEGHEIASHGYHHQLLYQAGPAEFREDIRRAKAAIENACGRPVLGYRAPSYSIIESSMGDGGCGTGAALLEYAGNGHGAAVNQPLDNVFFGPEFSEEEIGDALRRAQLPSTKYTPIEPKIASLIASGKVVARFNGRMEYGPRALGNRSILYHAKEPAVNQWLNQRLGRTEFMNLKIKFRESFRPFAPIVLRDEAHRWFGLDPQHESPYMPDQLMNRFRRIAIEWHEHIRPGVLGLLKERLSASHNIVQISADDERYGLLQAVRRN